MDNEVLEESHPQSWSSAEWRRAETNTSSADLADGRTGQRDIRTSSARSASAPRRSPWAMWS